MNGFITVTTGNGKKLFIAIRHIIFIEPLTAGCNMEINSKTIPGSFHVKESFEELQSLLQAAAK